MRHLYIFLFVLKKFYSNIPSENMSTVISCYRLKLDISSLFASYKYVK